MSGADVLVTVITRTIPSAPPPAINAAIRTAARVGTTPIYHAWEPVDLNRELVAEGFLDSRREWLVMLDDDIVPSAEAIENMLAVGGSVVVGSCPVVLGKPARLVANVRRSRAEGWLSWPLNESRPFMIDAAGFGCVLIHKSVFARLPRPWYVSDAGQTEDIYFCRQAREAGVPIVAHPGVVCDHCKPILIGAFAECLSKTDRLHPGHAME